MEENFFEQLKSTALGIYVEEMEHNGRVANDLWNTAEDRFNKLNWDTKKFYVDLAMAQIFLNSISD